MNIPSDFLKIEYFANWKNILKEEFINYYVKNSNLEVCFLITNLI